MKEQILLFNIPDVSVRNQLRNAFTALKITTKYIEKHKYSQPLGQLAGILPAKKNPAPYTGPELEASMMIFVNLPDAMLDFILKILQNFPVKFPYKAVLTATNAKWTATECFAEIKREHEFMHNG